MLARSGPLPSGDYAYEVKWDGFRAIVSTEGKLRVRSRRGWDMTEHAGLLAQLPVRAVLDGELVSLDQEGKPDFPQLCECVLLRQAAKPLTLMIFDVLSVEGEPVVSRPYRERRRILEELALDASQWQTPDPASFETRPAGTSAMQARPRRGASRARRP
jgi:bifunctional non-homologous end joining protein LigD